ncbi:MAG: hypothetical protein Q7S11_01580 [bacterium]|nr:hypothetical protein [bacterium]
MSNEHKLELCIAVGMFIVLLVLNAKITLYIVAVIGGFLIVKYWRLLHEYRRFFNPRFWLLILVLYFFTRDKKSSKSRNNL